jgi:hypothetical protein
MNNIVYAIYADSDPDTYMYVVTASKDEAERYVKNGFFCREMHVTDEEKARFLSLVK